MTGDPVKALQLLTGFAGADLTRTLSRIEDGVKGLTLSEAPAFLSEAGADRTVLAAAGEMKRLVGQINVTLHALGILICLPHILEPGERVEYVSLGAGNTGRSFDLETDRRIAEFKFINWRGGPESIRQNAILKDFFMLAESEGTKARFLYLLGTDHALKFLNGGRSIQSVLSRNNKIRDVFAARFGDRFKTVGGYYAIHAGAVSIVDVSPWVSELLGVASDEAE